MVFVTFLVHLFVLFLVLIMFLVLVKFLVLICSSCFWCLHVYHVFGTRCILNACHILDVCHVLNVCHIPSAHLLIVFLMFIAFLICLLVAFLVFVDNSSTTTFACYVNVVVSSCSWCKSCCSSFIWLVLPYPYIVLQVGISLKEGCWLALAKI